MIKILVLLLVIVCSGAFTPRSPLNSNNPPDFRGGGMPLFVAVSSELTNTAETLPLLTSWKDALFAGVTIVAAATSTTAMMVQASLIVSVVGWFCIALGVSSVILQKRLSELTSFATTSDRPYSRRHNQRRFRNAQLYLQNLTQAQGVSLEELIQNVQDYQASLYQKRLEVKQELQQLLEKELSENVSMDTVLERLKQSLPAGVEIQQDAFRKAILRKTPVALETIFRF